MLIEVGSMSAQNWIDWVESLRAEASLHSTFDNQTLARHLILWSAKRLEKMDCQMTAQTMVLLLNEIDQFRRTNWLYSKERRGPCSSVRGAYNEYANQCAQSDADSIADRFTNLKGEYAYQ